MPDIISKVVALVTGADGEGSSDKDILLKQLAKEITQNRYAKFYRVRQNEVDVPLGQFFYSVYKTVYPLQIFLRDNVKESRIRQITLEAFLDKKVMDIIKRLSPEGIAERKKNSGDNLTKLLEDDLAALAIGFDNPRIAAADKCYNLIAAMKQFVFFDFCSMLKKFDPEMKEGDFLSQPKISPVEGEIIMSDITAFVRVIPSFQSDDDWKTVFEILKYCKGGTDVIPPAHWNNMLASLKDIRESKILDLIGRLVTGNPILDIKTASVNETLSAQWMEEKTREVREVIAGIAGSQKQAQINALEKAVFGIIDTRRMTFYTAEKSNVLADKDLVTYAYAPALNHLAAFIQDFITKEVNDLCEILLVRGQWTKNSASKTMSDGFHEVLDMFPEITKLDESLEDEGSNGSRLRGALLRVDRDKTQSRYINAIVNSVNEQALHIINEAVPSLIVVGKHFKMLIDDFEKKPFELMMNWKELSLTSPKVPLNQRMIAIYKKINYFVQLMIMETKSTEE
jgi:hypothetical protein